MRKKRVLIAHGGGPTPVINASLAGVLRAARDSGSVEAVLVAVYGVEGLMARQVLDVTGMTDEEIEQLRVTPSSAIGSCRYRITEQDYVHIIEALEELRVDILFYTGGNDSMDTCEKLSRLTKNIQVIGIPKTIDNDLAGTDHSPGYGSAARFAALSAQEIGLDIRALPIHVTVVEFMGRNAGWITAASLCARTKRLRAPHLVYLPEQPFDEEEFLAEVTEKVRDIGGVVVAVSEGLRDAEGKSLVKPKHTTDFDSFGHAIPGDVSHHLSRLITTRTGLRSRSEKPGIMGRASLTIISQPDRDETYALGMYAMTSALAGLSGFMVGYERSTASAKTGTLMSMARFPLASVANVEHAFPESWILSHEELHPDFFSYVTPLMGSSIPEPFTFDLPKYPAVRRQLTSRLERKE